MVQIFSINGQPWFYHVSIEARFDPRFENVIYFLNVEQKNHFNML